MINNCKTLDELWKVVDKVNQENFGENKLKPILGDGKRICPKIMFIFINPTHVNISSDEKWQGPRFPFIGTKPIWRIFHKAGMFDDALIEQINKGKSWSLEFTDKVLNSLKSKSFYFTNIVKWTGHDASLPDSAKIKLFLPILENEIEIVKPQYIVTFGLIPFENITKQKIKLSEYYTKVMQDNIIRFVEMKFGDFQTKIIPCYFPIGRGSPKKAVEILKLVNSLVSQPQVHNNI